jgi:phosphate starvation-inducible membrane PsiE
MEAKLILCFNLPKLLPTFYGMCYRDGMSYYEKLKLAVEKVGYELVYWFHLTMLFIIGISVMFSAFDTIIEILSSGHAKVDDVLLLFIYLELGAMVGIYFTTNRMPVNFLLYIGITALTRMIVGILQHEHHTVGYDMLILVGSIFILALTVLVIKFSSAKFTIKPKKGAAALFKKAKESNKSEKSDKRDGV